MFHIFESGHFQNYYEEIVVLLILYGLLGKPTWFTSISG